MRLRNLIPTLFLFAASAFAQVSYNTITGTVNDQDDNPFASANITATLVNAQGVALNGAPSTPNGQLYNGSPVRGSLDEDGTFALALVPNAILTQRGARAPGGTQWLITISAPQDPNILVNQNAWNISYQFTVAGDADLSSQISALATQTISFVNLRTNASTFVGQASVGDMKQIAGSNPNQLAGFYNSTANCNGAAKPCGAQVDPSYGTSEHYNLDTGATSGTAMAAAQAMLLDFRSAAMTYISHDPPPNINASVYRVGAFFGCTNSATQAWTGGTGGISASNNCIRTQLFQRAPGLSLGNPGVGPAGWSVHKALDLESIVNSPGISEVISIGQIKAGVGDNTGIYTYHFNYGGATAPSDEGNEDGFQGGETNQTYAGTSAVSGTGLTSVKINCTIDCGAPGDGRYLIRTQSAVASGNVTAVTAPSGFTPGTLTADATVTPSTFWGTLAASVVTPATAPLGTGSTAMTFSVNKLGGSAPLVGDQLCFAGQFHEQAKISAVSGSGPYSITANLRHAHEASSWVMDGGTCGTFVELTANGVAPSNQRLINGAGQTLRHPIDIIGATDAHTLVYRFFAFGQPGSFAIPASFGQMQITNYSATSMTNTGGTVSFAINGAPPFFDNESTITISGASDSAFNGTCTNAHKTNFGAVACTQAASVGHSTPSTATVSLANGGFNLWAGAEVLDVQNTSGAIDGTMTLEPNNIAWSVGDTAEQPHHYAVHERLINGNLNITSPTGVANYGMAYGFGGEGISGGLYYGPQSSLSLELLSNTNSASIYAGHGGQLSPPIGFALLGPVVSGLSMQFAPDWIGSPVTFVGCPISGCNDPTYTYNLFTAASNASATQALIGFKPFAGSLLFNVPTHFSATQDGMTFGDNISFASMAAPANSGSHGIAGGTLTDATTYFYKVVALNGAGNSVASSEFTVTTGSNGGQNGVRVQWTRVPGATGYLVCRGATTGTEQQFYKNPGGWAGDTSFVDDLGVSINASGACLTADTSRGGIEQASHAGLNSPGTAFQANIKEPATLTANRNVLLPAVDANVTLAQIDSPAFTGTPTAPTRTAGDASTGIATDQFVMTMLASYATLVSPALAGVPTTPTDGTCGAHSTQVVNEAYVAACAPGGGSGSGTVNSGGSYALAAYPSTAATAVGPATGLKTDSTGNNLIVPGSIATGASAPTACGSAVGCAASTEGSTAGTPTAGQCYIRADSATHKYVYSCNGSAEAALGSGGGGGGLGNVQFTTNTTSVAPLSCTAEATISFAGLLTTSSLTQPTATGSNPTSIAGFAPGGTLYLSTRIISAGSMGWSLCNSSATSSVAAGASITWNIGAQ
jgi:hypothetical protein